MSGVRVSKELHTKAEQYIAQNRMDELRALLKAHPDLGQPGKTPPDTQHLIETALLIDRSEAVMALMEGGCPGMMPGRESPLLHNALRGLKVNSVRALLPFCREYVDGGTEDSPNAFAALCQRLLRKNDDPMGRIARAQECFDALLPYMDPNFEHVGGTPLHMLGRISRPADNTDSIIDHMVKRLVEEGADVNRTVNGRTPMDAAWTVNLPDAGVAPYRTLFNEPFMYALALCGGAHFLDGAIPSPLVEAVIDRAQEELYRLYRESPGKPLRALLLTADGRRASWLAHGLAAEGYLVSMLGVNKPVSAERLRGLIPLLDVFERSLPPDRYDNLLTPLLRNAELARESVAVREYISGKVAAPELQ